MLWLLARTLNIRVVLGVIFFGFVSLPPAFVAKTFPTSGAQQSYEGALAVSLLADGQLLIADASTRTLQAVTAMAPKDLTVNQTTGHFLGTNRDDSLVFVLVPSPRNEFVVINAKDGGVRARHLLTDAEYRSLDVGATSGRIYLFGNYSYNNVLQIAVFDEFGDQMLETIEFILPPYDWRIYQGLVSDDEQRFFVSYHSRFTGGVDWFDRQSGTLRRCEKRPADSVGCIAGHGGLSRDGDEYLVATGGSLINRVNESGTVVGNVDTGLAQNHLMEFAIDKLSRRLYAVGGCDYVPGLTVVDLKTGDIVFRQTSTPGPPSGKTICGERLATTSGGTLVVAQTATSVPTATRPGRLLFIDTINGAVLGAVATVAEPLDILMIKKQ